ncbi:hypothetical protein [Nostoc sp.]
MIAAHLAAPDMLPLFLHIKTGQFVQSNIAMRWYLPLRMPCMDSAFIYQDGGRHRVWLSWADISFKAVVTTLIPSTQSQNIVEREYFYDSLEKAF